ncbi:hypothetical protein C7377_0021 [Balneicella halophila]|uniref:Uncharacterized protein n=1 Tax=Balneicella halophila TaxID=1537566 RepID=A0A7L4UPQ1_BALHA|nr:hypothetical protein [Balneicella halophila]PVX51736.1 hypothetical protein C7377_0021 [Balneicella halophila]
MKRLVYSLPIIFIVMACSSTTSVHQSIWHNNTPKAPASIFHKTNGITLAVSNDSEFLYIDIESTNPQAIDKIRQLGLSVWLSKGANPNKTYGIHHPLPFKNTEDNVALEGFNQAPMVALPINDIDPLKIKSSLLPELMIYSLKVPLTEIDLRNAEIFTISVASFSLGKQEYLSGLTTAEEIERRLNEYKANPNYEEHQPELVPFYNTFQLAKKPNKNP